MADELRIGLSELLRKAMIDQDADFLKEGVRVLSQALMEMEVQERRSGAPRAERRAREAAQRMPRAFLGDEGGNGGSEGASGKGLELLPLAP